jgi:hypothetical protein
MTIINQAEFSQLTRLDQALMWAIVSINASNLDPRNTFISDNAAIRAESANYVQWSVTQDDYGRGRFVYTALLPLVNPRPLQDKQSLIERVWSYSPFDPTTHLTAGSVGYGTAIPTIPTWADTTEKLLTYIGILASSISKYARMTNRPAEYWADKHPEYWADCHYQISDSAYGGSVTLTGSMSIDWATYLKGKSLIKCLNPPTAKASDINCNLPRLDLLWQLPTVDLTDHPDIVIAQIPSSGGLTVGAGGIVINVEGSAGALIDSYNQGYFTDDALPDWYLKAVQAPSENASSGSGGTQVLGGSAPQLIETLPVCKEQDPTIASYANQLASKINLN